MVLLRILRLSDYPGRHIERWRLDKFCSRFLVRKQGFDFFAQVLVLSAFLVEKCRSLICSDLQGGVIQMLDLTPAFRLHPMCLHAGHAAARPWRGSSPESPYRKKSSIPLPCL